MVQAKEKKYHNGARFKIHNWLTKGMPLTELESLLLLRVVKPAVAIKRMANPSIKTRKVKLSQVLSRVGVAVPPAGILVRQGIEKESLHDIEVMEWYLA